MIPVCSEWAHQNCYNDIGLHSSYKTHIHIEIAQRTITQIWFRWGKSFASSPIVWDGHDQTWTRFMHLKSAPACPLLLPQRIRDGWTQPCFGFVKHLELLFQCSGLGKTQNVFCQAQFLLILKPRSILR